MWRDVSANENQTNNSTFSVDFLILVFCLFVTWTAVTRKENGDMTAHKFVWLIGKMSASWCSERGRAAKSLIINVSCCVWSSKDEMNRCTLSAIFICVSVVSLTFLLEYFKAQGDNIKQHSITRPQQKVFSPLPDASQLHIPDEGTLGLVLRKTDVSSKPEKKNSGKLYWVKVNNKVLLFECADWYVCHVR